MASSNGTRARVGYTPSRCGTPGALVAQRSWDDYDVGRADAISHLGALDVVYPGVITDHRAGIEQTEELTLRTAGTQTERAAAQQAAG